nr:hypothetical protein [uncultured Flavobacterium sp.]
MNNRFYIDTYGNDDQAYDNAYKFALKLAKTDINIKKIIFLVATKSNTGWLDRLYGETTVKQLYKGIRKDTLLLKIETIKTYSDSYSNAAEVVIACGLNSKEIFKVEDYRNVEYIIAIPWLKELTQSWITTKNPSILNIEENDIVAETKTDNPKPSAIIQEAFNELTKVINTSTGISHHMDNARAKTYIRTLYKYESDLNSDLICSYLVNELGWEVRHSNDVRKLIDTLNSGKYFVGGDKIGLQNHYKRWKNSLN